MPLVGGGPASSASSRLAAVSGGSPSTSSSPAGSSSSRPPTGWPVLVDEHDLLVVVEGDDTDGARVRDDLALGDRAVAASAPGRAAPRSTRPVEDRARLDQRLVLVPHELGQRHCWRPAARRAATSADAGGRRSLVVGDLDRQPLGVVVVQRGGDERAEQRVRPGRAGLELRVRLGADEERVHLARQLDELDQPAVRRGPGDDQPGRLELARGRRC